jgi:hypothetical protein
MSNTETAIVRHENNGGNLIIRTMDDAERAAKAMATSGFFADAKQASQAVVKILAGQELGFGPFASMTGVHIIQNKPTLAANLMAAAIKRGGKYNYRVAKLDEKECSLDFFEAKEKVGTSTFTMEDAQKAGVTGKAVWKQFPRNMLFARALSNGQKWYAPDVFSGATVYTPEELGAEVDADGNVVSDGAPSNNGHTAKGQGAPTTPKDVLKILTAPAEPAPVVADNQERVVVEADEVLTAEELAEKFYKAVEARKYSREAGKCVLADIEMVAAFAEAWKDDPNAAMERTIANLNAGKYDKALAKVRDSTNKAA